MKKRMLSLLCAVAIVLSMIIPSAFAVTDTTCDCGATDVQWETLTASTTPQPGKHYRLTGDVTWSSQMSLKTEGTYCIDLAGYTLQNKTNRAFLVGNSGTSTKIVMNIMDSSANKSGKLLGGTTSTAASGGSIYLYSGVVFNLYGGTVGTHDPANNKAKIGAIFQLLGSSTLNVYGGTIVGATALQQAGAVNVAATSVLNVYGGSIISGTAPTAPCVYVDSTSSKVKLSGNANVEEIYFNSTPSSSLTISGTYTGSVTIDAKNAITSGTTIAVGADSANIAGARISVKGTDFAAGLDGTNIVVSAGSWCQACQKNVVWTNLSSALPASANGHYKLTKNVSASQVSLQTSNTICVDLNGFTYTSSGRLFLLGGGAGTNAVTLNVMDNSKEQKGVMQSYGGSAYTAGGIYAYKNTAFNLYSGTLRAVAEEGCGNLGAVIATSSTCTIGIYGGKIIGGHAYDQGGAIYLRSSGVLNIAGGSIEGGTSVNEGSCVCVASGGIVNLSGNGSVEQLYFEGDSSSKLTITGDYTGKAELKFKTTPALGADIGNCSNATVLRENVTIAGTTMCGMVSGSNLVTTNLQGVSVTDSEGNVTYFDTLAAAAAVCGKDDTIKLLTDNSENVTIANGTLDLFGWDLTGNITVTGKLYVKDSATDDFTVNDAKGYGKIANITGTVEGAEGYLPLNEADGISYHKYVLKLAKVNLRPGKTALYYTGDIRVDEAVQAEIDRFGVAVSTANGKPVADDSDATSLYTAYGKDDYGTTGTASVMITNILDGGADDAAAAATNVYGRPYIKFANGDIFYGNVACANLKQITELIDANSWTGLSLSQNRALRQMYATYKAGMTGWTLENLRASEQKAEEAANDRLLKVLVIGNSHGLDSTNLLYEVFKAEGIPAEYDNVVIGAIYTGGCSVSTHAKNALGDLTYDYWKKNDGTKANGEWYHYEDPTTREVLDNENWDVVLLQEMNTSSARSEYFENDNIETVFTFVVNTLGYEPQFMWNMIWANPEIPESYVNHLYKDGDDGSGGDVGSGSEGDDNDTSDAATIARRLAWIFQTQQPGALETWGKNYVKLWENNRQVMYNNIVSNVQNYVIGKEVHNIGQDDVMANATAIQYAIEWMGMHEQDMYRDYTHVSDLGRLIVSYLWYAKLTGKTSIDAPNYTLVSQTLENSRQPLGYAKDYSQYSEVIRQSVNFALADPYGVIQNYTYAEYLALTPEKQAEYEASFENFSKASGWTYEMWLEQAVANTTYTEYVRMTEEQRATYAALNKNFDSWYKNVVENLRYVEYFLLTDEEEIAYDELRGEAYDAWFEAAANNFTYTDYVMMTYEQQQAYKETFSNAEGFDNLYNSWLAHMSYEEFMGLTMHQKLQYRKTYSSIAKFLEWYNAVKP